MTTATKKKAPTKAPEKNGPTAAQKKQAAAVKAQKDHDAELEATAAKLDAIQEKLEEAAADTGDGSVNDPAVIASHALDHFNAYRNHPYFQAIINAV